MDPGSRRLLAIAISLVSLGLVLWSGLNDHTVGVFVFGGVLGIAMFYIWNADPGRETGT